MSDYNISTPILPLSYTDGYNQFYIKRDDLLPFSFGGNKVRITNEYIKDMITKGYNCIISYGSKQSNLNRVIANVCKSLGIPCYIVSPTDNSQESPKTFNNQIIKLFDAEIITCKRDEIPDTIEYVMNLCKEEGLKPYYINGDKYGRGNKGVPVEAYVKVYEEILDYEKQMDLEFDYIFHASGTGTTQAGLICGQIKNDDTKKIIGISIARNQEAGTKSVKDCVESYLNEKIDDNDVQINFIDKYNCGGYGKVNNNINKMIENILGFDGVSLDTTYTGKAFWGMTEYLRDKSIEDSKILFIHTGGTPLFFDDIAMRKEEEY